MSVHFDLFVEVPDTERGEKAEQFHSGIVTRGGRHALVAFTIACCEERDLVDSFCQGVQKVPLFSGGNHENRAGAVISIPFGILRQLYEELVTCPCPGEFYLFQDDGSPGIFIGLVQKLSLRIVECIAPADLFISKNVDRGDVVFGDQVPVQGLVHRIPEVGRDEGGLVFRKCDDRIGHDFKVVVADDLQHQAVGNSIRHLRGSPAGHIPGEPDFYGVAAQAGGGFLTGIAQNGLPFSG